MVDPHTAVGLGSYFIQTMTHSNTHYFFLATAHPYKFQEIIKSVIPDIHIATNKYINYYTNISINKIYLENDLQLLKKKIISTLS